MALTITIKKDTASGRYRLTVNYPPQIVLGEDGRPQLDARGRHKRRYPRERHYFDTQTAANAWRDHFLSDPDHADAEPTRETLSEYLTRWLDDYAAVELTPKTVSRYRSIVKRHIIPKLGAIPLQDLRPKDLQRAYRQWLADGLAPATVRQHHAVIRSALACAVDEESVTRNVAAKAKPPALPHHEPKVLSEAATRALLAAIAAPQRKSPHYRLEAPAGLALYCGLRRGEICGLRRTDINLSAGTLTVARSVEQVGGELRVKQPKSAAGRRTLPVPAELATILKAQSKRLAAEKLAGGPDYHDNGLVCPEWDGSMQKPDTLGACFGRAAARRGFPGVTLHTLRRTYATALAAHGVPPKDAQYLLGHASLQTTLGVYTATTERMQDQARAAVSAAFGASR